jgi:hypothetical protein
VQSRDGLVPAPRAADAWLPAGVRWLCLSVALILQSACVRPPLPSTMPMLGFSSLSVGEWEGTTSQGKPITFTVSPDEKVTSIIVGYGFNECSGTREFFELSVPTAPDVTCMPGPCSPTLASYRAFGFSDGKVAGEPYTQVNGVFLPRHQAKGQAIFRDFPNCGSATVQWTATRR